MRSNGYELDIEEKLMRQVLVVGVDYHFCGQYKLLSCCLWGIKLNLISLVKICATNS